MNDCLNKFDHNGTMANFDPVARGELHADHGGAPWFNGLCYEMIRGGRFSPRNRMRSCRHASTASSFASPNANRGAVSMEV